MKTKTTLLRWLPVMLNITAAIALVLSVFWPFHRKAGDLSVRAEAVTRDLEQKFALLTQLPLQKQELDSLVRRLGAFRSDLFHTDQVDLAMRSLETRAEEAGVVFWQLNPSVPTLLTLDRERDSIAALNLALLPVEFECLGDFVQVGRFLEQEERRPQFCQWRRLSVGRGDGPERVRARGEILLFLLPAEGFAEESA